VADDNSPPTDEEITCLITDEDLEKNLRLDKFLSIKLPDFSRTFIRKMYDSGLISSDSSGKLELKRMPPSGTTIKILIPPPVPMEAQAEDLPLEVLFEDEHLLFINKAAGMVTHPAPGNYTGTLVNAILHHCPDLKGIGNVKRPGIVHRLDKGTSGVMVVAKTQKTLEGLILLFSTHDIVRKYQCLAIGVKLPKEGTLSSTIGRHPIHRQKMKANVKNGKDSITHFRVLEYFEKLSHIELTLETGRTHQIRVHLSELVKSPILMDPAYGNPKSHIHFLTPAAKKILKDYPYPLLHAKTLGLVHPITGESLLIETPPPSPFYEVLNSLQADQ